MSILVTYATHYGSTQEVAEVIANHLREVGCMVELEAMQEVISLDSFSSVILGSPIYTARWHPHAHQFLNEHQFALRQRSLAIFALGPISSRPDEMQTSRLQLQQDLAQYPWLKPVSQGVFIGKYNPANLSPLHRFITQFPNNALFGLSASDDRNWQAIETWTKNLVRKLECTPISF